jgi:hypothetical protein
MEYVLMNEINNNVAFGANLVTKMKGRDKIVSKISEEFTRRTPELKGSLCINRGGQIADGALMFELDKKNSPAFFMHNYTKSLFGKKQEEVTPKFIDTVVTQFIKIYKLLQEESRINDVFSSIDANISQTKGALNHNLKVSNLLKKEGKDTSANVYKSLANHNRGRLEFLTKDKAERKEAFIKKCYEICDSDENLEQYVDVLDTVVD